MEKECFMSFDFRNRSRVNPPPQNKKNPAGPKDLQSTGAGLFWSEMDNALYRAMGEKYILYSRDRRKKSGVSPTGLERRTKKVS